MKKIIGVILILVFGVTTVAVAQQGGITQETDMKEQLGGILEELEGEDVDTSNLQQIYDRLGKTEEGGFCYQFEENLEYKDDGKDVKALEEALTENTDFTVSEANGRYDQKTAEALREYQQDHDIKPDNLVERVGFKFGETTRKHFNKKYECGEEEEKEEYDPDSPMPRPEPPIAPNPTHYEVRVHYNRDLESGDSDKVLEFLGQFGSDIKSFQLKRYPPTHVIKLKNVARPDFCDQVKDKLGSKDYTRGVNCEKKGENEEPGGKLPYPPEPPIEPPELTADYEVRVSYNRSIESGDSEEVVKYFKEFDSDLKSRKREIHPPVHVLHLENVGFGGALCSKVETDLESKEYVDSVNCTKEDSNQEPGQPGVPTPPEEPVSSASDYELRVSYTTDSQSADYDKVTGYLKEYDPNLEALVQLSEPPTHVINLSDVTETDFCDLMKKKWENQDFVRSVRCEREDRSDQQPGWPGPEEPVEERTREEEIKRDQERAQEREESFRRLIDRQKAGSAGGQSERDRMTNQERANKIIELRKRLRRLSDQASSTTSREVDLEDSGEVKGAYSSQKKRDEIVEIERITENIERNSGLN